MSRWLCELIKRKAFDMTFETERDKWTAKWCVRSIEVLGDTWQARVTLETMRQ